MKGIAHFASALAVASFLPQVVERSAQGSLVLLLAGIGGLMPDTLDFRLARFLPKPDLEIDADSCSAPSGGLDAQVVAERLAAAIERAHRTGNPILVRLGTIKLGADLWQQYSVGFDRGQVQVCAGPLVDGAQSPVQDAHRPVGGAGGQGQAAVAVPMWQGAPMPARVVVDVFSGTALEFRPYQAGIEIVFLPWHRQWSHSLILTALLGAVVVLLAGPLAGLAYALGSLTHILEDQLGHMGTNLLYPFTRRRTAGLGLFHSGDPLPNLFAVWLSAVLLLMNVDRFSPVPLFEPWRWLLAGLVIPWSLIGVPMLHPANRMKHPANRMKHPALCPTWSAWTWHRRQRAAGAPDPQSSLAPLTLVDVSQDGERVLVREGFTAEGQGDE